jgi:hypothetical protein
MPFVLMIRELRGAWGERGPITEILPTRAEAEAELLGYVRENWESKMCEDLPEDEDELVVRYFDCVPEAYDIADAA